MEVKRCSDLQGEKEKREGPDMEVKRCSGKKREGSGTELKPWSDLPGRKKKKRKRERKRRTLFYVFRRLKDNYIYKIDVNRQFFPPTAHINYSGRSKATRIAGHDWQAPSMWRPYMYFESTGKAGELPNDTALVALGSEIYLIGGHSVHRSLPREVYVIDTVEDYPEVWKKKKCVLNWGKRQPIAWTIRGNIYVMPHTFSDKVFFRAQFNSPHSKPAGKFFERYDPDSNSWTILPSPAVENLNLGCANEHFDPLLITSHAVLGSKLLISVGTSGLVFALDTARTDRGWTKIRLELEHGPRRRLNILPLDPRHSSPLGDNLVLCYPRVVVDQPQNSLRQGPVKEQLGIDCDKDYYVCRFGDIDENGDLKASIVPFDGSSLKMRWHKFFHPDNDTSSQVTLLGEDLFLFAKVGCDYDSLGEFFSKSYTEPEIGDFYLSFELFRLSQTEAPRQYQASATGSALFKADEDLVTYLELFRCFVMEDGLFVN